MDVPLLAVLLIFTSSREERKELRYSVVCLTVRELCSAGICVCKHTCAPASSPPSQCPMGSYLLALPQYNP
jgi:hypothetical protein